MKRSAKIAIVVLVALLLLAMAYENWERSQFANPESSEVEQIYR